MKTYVHVNKNTIASNRKHGRCEPAVRFQRGKYGAPTYAFEVAIDGPSKMVYQPSGPPILPCGARLVIETDAPVRVVK